MNTYFHLTVMLFALLASCQQAPEILSESEKNKIAGEVSKTLNDYCEDVRKHGFMAELKYLDNSPDFFWAPPGYEDPLDYDSVVAIITLNAPRFSQVENKWESLHIKVLNSDLASYSGRIQSIMTDTSGISTKVRLMETGLMIRRNRDWKLLSGQTSVIR